MLVGEHGSDQADGGSVVGEDPDDVGPSFHFLVQPLEPLPQQRLAAEDEKRLANLGQNGPRDTSGLTMTHCVPNERVVVER